MSKTVGKQFEENIKASIPEGVYYQRLKDPAQAFGGGNAETRFSPQNPYDCFMYSYPNLYTLELKTVARSMTFWRESFDKSKTKSTYNIKKHQINGLLNAAEHKGAIAGFILNFRDTNKTYFVEINRFVEVTNHMAKKSLNQIDVLSMGILIPQHQLKVNWRYDIQHLIDKVGEQKGR